MGLLDVIVLVLVIVAVVSRFTKFKLPKDLRDKHSRRADLDRLRGRPLLRDDQPEAVDVTAQAEAVRPPRKPAFKEMQAAAKNLTGMAKIKALEPSFDEAAFLDGAKGAYGYFYTCWNAKDEQGLDDLCAPGLHGRLLNELNDKAYAPVEVEYILSAEVLDARVNGRTAIIDVQFVTLEREGNSVARERTSVWVLARPLGSEDPNWELQDIRVRADS